MTGATLVAPMKRGELFSPGGFVPWAFAIGPLRPRSPWQNGHAERLIGSLRWECLDRVVVFGERHLRQVVPLYMEYYNNVRTHRSLNKDASIPRPVQFTGRILSTPILGGLHHQYIRI